MKFSDLSKKGRNSGHKKAHEPLIPEYVPENGTGQTPPETEKSNKPEKNTATPAPKQPIAEHRPDSRQELPSKKEFFRSPTPKSRADGQKTGKGQPQEPAKDSLWSKITGLGIASKESAGIMSFPKPTISSPAVIPLLNDTDAYADYLRAQNDQAYNLYEYSILTVRYALLSLLCEDRTAFGPIAQASENITTMLDSGNQSLVALAGRHYMPDNNSRHSVNVAIYSVFLCELLNMKKEERVFVGCAALLHDLGMQKYERLINKPDKFTLAERQMIQRHPIDASKIIENLEGIDKNTAQTLAKVVTEVYEKYDGSGYPFQKQGEAISQHAQIISIANVYEALTHPRSWRKELNQHEALKMMLDNAGNSFSKKIVRLLIDGLSMYPPGTLVKLSTGDTARVIEVNPKLISQPKVEVVSGNGPARFLNLATEKGILITSVVSKDPREEF